MNQLRPILFLVGAMGMVFLAVAAVTRTDQPSDGWLLPLGIGALLVAVAVLLLWPGRLEAIQRAMDVTPVTDATTGRVRFARSPAGTIVHHAAPLVIGLSFLGAAIATGIERQHGNGVLPIAMTGIGLVVVAVGIRTIRHVGDPAVVVVGPDGIWLPDVGMQPWDAWAQVLLEQPEDAPRRLILVPVTDPAPGGSGRVPAHVDELLLGTDAFSTLVRTIERWVSVVPAP